MLRRRLEQEEEKELQAVRDKYAARFNRKYNQ